MNTLSLSACAVALSALLATAVIPVSSYAYHAHPAAARGYAHGWAHGYHRGYVHGAYAPYGYRSYGARYYGGVYGRNATFIGVGPVGLGVGYYGYSCYLNRYGHRVCN